ncbi:hypothetical protein GCM10027610_113530 [Dactylosporangium cerinum]
MEVGEAQRALVEGGDDEQRPLVADLVEDRPERLAAVAADHAGVLVLHSDNPLCLTYIRVPFVSPSIVTHHVPTYDW